MDRDSEFKTESGNLPEQIFNGKTYYLYPNEYYFSKGRKRLHRVVWEHYKEPIPKGYHIHHKDGNTHNNDINNLSLVKASLHYKFEGKKRFKSNKEWFKEFHDKGIEAAKEWHKSDEGRKWHSEQAIKSYKKREFISKECEQCGKKYETRHAGVSKFCHQNCKAKALRSRRKREREGL